MYRSTETPAMKYATLNVRYIVGKRHRRKRLDPESKSVTGPMAFERVYDTTYHASAK